LYWPNQKFGVVVSYIFSHNPFETLIGYSFCYVAVNTLPRACLILSYFTVPTDRAGGLFAFSQVM